MRLAVPRNVSRIGHLLQVCRLLKLPVVVIDPVESGRLWILQGEAEKHLEAETPSP